MSIIIFLFTTVAWFFLIFKSILNYLHILQLEGYSISKFQKWADSNQKKIYSKLSISFINISFFLTLMFMLFYNSVIVRELTLLSYVVLYFVTYIRLKYNKKNTKKPFIYTKRAKRLVVISISRIIILYMLTLVLVYIFCDSVIEYLPVSASLLSIIYFFNINIAISSNKIALPLENRINKHFFNLAYKKIRSFDKLVVVGITGSYGKTSTKFVTSTILQEKYKVIKTPESYNTPMGISKVINNDIHESHQIFVAELGATKIGDIKEIAELTNPNIAIITSIGPCHLESFGSIENIKKTKYEVIENLSDDGIAIFNYDNEYLIDLADKTKNKKLLYGTENIDKLDVYASDIIVDDGGSTFMLNIRNFGSIQCHTQLLGKHNILNILAGVCVATIFEMSLLEIKMGISRIISVKHRLQLIDPKTGILVIDDAFNSNPDGASAALEVLGQFENKRKIIITPGMVELGSVEYEENYKFGEKISTICDIVILVGKKRTMAILAGLRKNNFNLQNIYYSLSPQQTSSIIKDVTRPGDVILFENDLPDTYDEN
ncbi:UDP-N-acetylmuramoyl-tripeptide--D-alanyl-D-alanine ligase [Sedimentibacter sp. zth1]|uniref:UDP-N-acetylmuramoyl-tripeptide--D-alanyl-D- alanine ligase n=1 Tax=Sedimentibacter sp. zth1 TaxID=2816908 RepID=UPI001A939EA1|nr:UDP-N-acetylmuramoyl-tripeptide--D-alanyl-D-alanine ligase [Sedimentibacter sp. zth1]QSX06244.1 UDP-N-acetylmuramoyl-tripeptide--D-alanyl-D-alanine ligase [Sedimentibacter sp. zth1]